MSRPTSVRKPRLFGCCTVAITPSIGVIRAPFSRRLVRSIHFRTFPSEERTFLEYVDASRSRALITRVKRKGKKRKEKGTKKERIFQRGLRTFLAYRDLYIGRRIDELIRKIESVYRLVAKRERERDHDNGSVVHRRELLKSFSGAACRHAGNVNLVGSGSRPVHQFQLYSLSPCF